jgi:hypothetical protein
MKEGLSQGLAAARQLGSPALLHGVQSAFVQGMDAAVLVSAGICCLGLVLTLVFMPLRTPAVGPVSPADAAASAAPPRLVDAAAARSAS